MSHFYLCVRCDGLLSELELLLEDPHHCPDGQSSSSFVYIDDWVLAAIMVTEFAVVTGREE